MTDSLMKQQLLKAYSPMLSGIARAFQKRVPESVCSYEDLYAEAIVAFLEELGKLDDPHDIAMRRRAIVKAVTRYVIQNYALSVPYASVYSMGEMASTYQKAASLDEILEDGTLPAAEDDPLDDMLTVTVEEEVLCNLTEDHRIVLTLLKENHKREEIASMLSLTHRQTRRRIEELRAALLSAFVSE